MKFYLRLFALWLSAGAVLSGIGVFHLCDVATRAIAADDEEGGVITIKNDAGEIKRIIFRQQDLNRENLKALVRERLIEFAPDKFSTDKPPCGGEARKISDDCWSCRSGQIICTTNAKLRSALADLLK